MQNEITIKPVGNADGQPRKQLIIINYLIFNIIKANIGRVIHAERAHVGWAEPESEFINFAQGGQIDGCPLVDDDVTGIVIRPVIGEETMNRTDRISGCIEANNCQFKPVFVIPWWSAKFFRKATIPVFHG